MKLTKVILLSVMVLSSIRVGAQTDSWRIGGGVGVNSGKMVFTNLDKNRYDKNQGSLNAVYSLFLERDFGTRQNIMVRPQVSLLSRGGKLTGFEKFGGYSDPDVEDVFYQVNAKFADLRCAVAFLLGNGGIRPYVGVTPIVAIPFGGDIRLQGDFKDFYYKGYKANLNKSNFASYYFAVAPTVGFRFDLDEAMFIGLEASYQIGLTDTYSSVEKNGNANDILRGAHYKFDGKRKLNGLEVQVTVGIPLGRRTKAAPAPVERYVEPAPAPVEKPKKTVLRKTCYTLEEISDMLARNESVSGKTLCAVDAINFDFAKSTIKRESHEYLDRLAEVLIRTRSSVVVKGHTDNTGSDEVNMRLSKERAEAVVKYLVSRGMDKNLLSVEYYGSSQPIMDNDTEEGRTYNRRVEFEIQK